MTLGALRLAALIAMIPAAAMRAEDIPWPGSAIETEPASARPLNEESNPARLLGTLAIRAYKNLASPLMPGRCAFFPSCSSYVLAAISAHGLINGAIMGSDRISRCHGFAVLGGYPARPQDSLFDDPIAGKPAPLPWLSRFGL